MHYPVLSELLSEDTTKAPFSTREETTKRNNRKTQPLVLKTVIGNSRGNQYGENQKTNVLIHRQTERCWTNRNAFYQNREKRKINGQKWTWKIKLDTGLQDEIKQEREKPERYVIQSFMSQIIIDEVKLIWLKTIGKQQKERERKREIERETLTSLRLGCLSHSHLHKDHVRRQSITYLPFQSVTRMQYQQKTGKKEKKEKKRRKECSPQRKWEKDNDLF